MPLRKRILVGVLLISALFGIERAHAFLYTKQIYRPDEAVATQPDAPRGLFELLNDAHRMKGWTVAGTEVPFDFQLFSFQVMNTADAAAVIKLLSQIDAPVRLELDPRWSAPPGIIPGVGEAAVFIQSSQHAVDAFMDRYAKLKPAVGQAPMMGSDKWIDHLARGAQPPKATAYTLRLYIGSERIDLSKLDVPAKVEVGGPTLSPVVFDPGWKYEPALSELVAMKSIEEFITSHQAKRASAPATQPAGPEPR